MKETIHLVIGWMVILMSLILFLPFVLFFYLGTLVGWTTDNPEIETTLVHVGRRMEPALLLFLNILLLYSGIKISQNKLTKMTYISLALGLLPLLLMLNNR